jgi:hypothetical protein
MKAIFITAAILAVAVVATAAYAAYLSKDGDITDLRGSH